MPPDNPQQALRSLAAGWLNYGFDNSTGLYSKTDQATAKAGDNLIDKLANAGGYVLPFSYVPGTKMSGAASSPSFTVTSYTSGDVAKTHPITTGPSVLQDEITSIHRVFKHVPIVIVGHSNGGLIANQWWLQYGSHDAEGVVQVFALDSPLNGVSVGTLCATSICALGGVGPIVGAAYSALWDQQATNDPVALKLDDKDHLFTAIGDIGDPLYDFADYPASQGPTGGVKNIGLVSQLYWTEPSCVQSGYDLSKGDCTASGQAIVNPCGHNLDDGSGPIFGMPGDLWLHSLVKNCPGTIQAVLNHVAGAPSSSAGSNTTSGNAGGASPSTIDSCLVGKWTATDQTLQATVNGTLVNLSGGAGGVLTLNPDGTFSEDSTNAQPVTRDVNGNSISVDQSGTATGHFSASGGKISFTYDDPTAITFTTSVNGNDVGTEHLSNGTVSYTCHVGQQFTITEQYKGQTGVIHYGPG